MGQAREVDITAEDIDRAIIETEREIAGGAWGDEETDALDNTGDRSLESMGEGLEGQHEQDEDEAEGEDEADGESEDGEDGEGDGESEQAEAAQQAEGDKKPDSQQAQQGEQERTGRVPAGVHRKLREERDAVTAERDGLKAEIETLKAQGASKGEIDALKAQVAGLTQVLQGLRQSPQNQQGERKAEPAKAPDIFENPQGFVDYITNQIRSEIGGVRQDQQRQGVETSFRIAHVRHGDAFPKAMDAINKLNVNNPDDRATVQRIYNSPDPGEALVAWHKRNEVLARVGEDPTAYEARIREETRNALMSDPEFKKQLIASLRQDAQQGDDGRPRTSTRLPTSLNRASGSNLGTRDDSRRMDDSEQAVSDAAWR